jgi:hypothetical protein
MCPATFQDARDGTVEVLPFHTAPHQNFAFLFFIMFVFLLFSLVVSFSASFTSSQFLSTMNASSKGDNLSSDDGQIEEHDDSFASHGLGHQPRHERYREVPQAHAPLLDVAMYDSDSSPIRSQIGGGRHPRSSSIPPGNYSTPTRLHTYISTTPHAGIVNFEAVTRRAQLVPSNHVEHPIPSIPSGLCALSNPLGSPGSANAGTINPGPLMDAQIVGSPLDMSVDNVFRDGGMILDFGADLSVVPNSTPDLQHFTATFTPPSSIGISLSPSEAPRIPEVASSHKGGHISNANCKKLDEGFATMDNVLAGLVDGTGFSEDRILSLWSKQSGRKTMGFNPWNVYKGYLKANIVDELSRAGLDAPEGIKWEDTTHEQRLSCYAAFRKEYGNNVWEDILRAFDLSRKCETAGTTFSKRSSDFHKVTSHLMRLVSISLLQMRLCKTNVIQTDSWQSKHGFETMWVMCGNVPNDDSQLTTSYESANAKQVRVGPRRY